MHDWRTEFRAIVATVAGTTALPDLVGECARAQAIAQTRMAERNAPPMAAADTEPDDRLLNVQEAAGMLGVEPRWLYRRADRLPFTRKLGPRTLRFSEVGVRRWLETRK